MKKSLFNTTLLFKKPFQLNHGTRLGTKALFLKIEHNQLAGYSEATFPPYLNESDENTAAQINQLDPTLFDFTVKPLKFQLLKLDDYNLSPFTRSLVVNCLYDLQAKLNNKSLKQELGLNNSNNYKSSFTITKSDLDSLDIKKETARQFNLIKLKLDGDNDLEFVNIVLKHIHKPFCVDANQGWENIPMNECIKLVNELKKMGCELIEQPFLKTNYSKHKDLSLTKIIPVFADEGIQNETELIQYGSNFDGVNIKILKCGGVDRAMRMAMKAKEMGKKIIIGCMSESSCGCSTAFALSSLADYLDIDGPWLIKNDPFEGFMIKDGKFETALKTGTGIYLSNEFN